MINAVINHGDGTLVLELPHNIYGIHEKLMSIGYSGGPHRVTLTDNEGDALRVKLYGTDDTGNHLLRLLTDQNTLADANTMAFVVQNASADIKEKLTEKIAMDRYDSLPELVADIRQMTYDAGPVKQTYYCPLTAELVDEDDYSCTVSNRFLRDYAEMIREAVNQERDRDDQDMAEYYHGDDGLKSKLASMVWGVELYRGRLFGKIDCSFKEELTPAEEELLKDYITGQNSDGWGEGFEQRPLETEDGDLYVSFWNSGDDYPYYGKGTQALTIYYTPCLARFTQGRSLGNGTALPYQGRKEQPPLQAALAIKIHLPPRGYYTHLVAGGTCHHGRSSELPT